jgi:hypothetical protein
MSTSLPASSYAHFSTIKNRISAPTSIVPREEQGDFYCPDQHQNLGKRLCLYDENLLQDYHNENRGTKSPLISMCGNNISHFEAPRQSKWADPSQYSTRPVMRRNRSGRFQRMPTIHQSDVNPSSTRASLPNLESTYEEEQPMEESVSTKSKQKAKTADEQESEERIDSLHSNLSATSKFLEEFAELRGSKRAMCCHKGECGTRRKCDGDVRFGGETEGVFTKRLEESERWAFAEQEATEQAMLRNLPVLRQSHSAGNLLSDSYASMGKKSSRYRQSNGQPLTKEQRRASVMRWCEGALSVLSLGSSSAAKSNRTSSIFSFRSKSAKKTSSPTWNESSLASRQSISPLDRPRTSPLYQPGNGPPQFVRSSPTIPWMDRVTAVPRGSNLEEKQFLALQAAERRYVSLRELQEQERRKRQSSNFQRRVASQHDHNHQSPYTDQPALSMRGERLSYAETLANVHSAEMALQQRLRTAGIMKGDRGRGNTSLLEHSELAKRTEESAQRKVQPLVLHGTLMQQRQQLLSHRHLRNPSRASSSLQSKKSVQTQSGDLTQLHKTRIRSHLDSGSIGSMQSFKTSDGEPKPRHQNRERSNSV